MAETSKNKIYYNDNEDSIADVLEDMKKLAESTDNAIEKAKYNDTELKNKNTAQDEEIAQIKSKDTAQDRLIEQLQTKVVNLEAENVSLKNQIPSGEATGNPIHLTDSSNLECEIVPVGNAVQDGTPTPDTPIEIVTVGQNGSIEIEVCNKNFLGLKDIEENTLNGITYSCKNGVIKLNGTATSSFGIILKHNKFTLFKGIKYVGKMIVTNKPGVNTSVISIRDMNNNSRFYMECWVSPKIKEITPEDNIYFKDDQRTNLWINSGAIFSNTEFIIQIEEGSNATDITPHQSYTKVLPIQEEMLDEDYISDKEYHNWEKIDSYNGEEITTDFKSTTGELTTGATVYYKLAKPKELELTEEQKAVLNSFHTYKGITNISVDGIGTLKVNYKKDLETIINKLSATSVAE